MIEYCEYQGGDCNQLKLNTTLFGLDKITEGHRMAMYVDSKYNISTLSLLQVHHQVMDTSQKNTTLCNKIPSLYLLFFIITDWLLCIVDTFTDNEKVEGVLISSIT